MVCVPIGVVPATAAILVAERATGLFAHVVAGVPAGLVIAGVELIVFVMVAVARHTGLTVISVAITV